MCRLFSYWRGSIVFTFKIVKTNYHSGRLLFCAIPNDSSTSVDVTISTSAYLNREIMDIREGAVYKVVVPYASLRPWLRCSTYSNGVTSKDWFGNY